MPESFRNTKHVPTRWKNVQLRKMQPDVYPRYYRRQPGFSQLVPGHHFYINQDHSWSEVFFEQVDNGFWLLAIEILGKCNNHYILQPNKSNESYYSINFFSTAGRLGYKEDDCIRWVSNHVSFIGPGISCELYQEKDAILSCCRMIFTADYLSRLINIDPDHLTELYLKGLKKKNIRNHLQRAATKAEIFLNFRLFNVLRYEYGKCHYRASIFGNVFELTAFFLNYLCRRVSQGRSTSGGIPISC